MIDNPRYEVYNKKWSQSVSYDYVKLCSKHFRQSRCQVNKIWSEATFLVFICGGTMAENDKLIRSQYVRQQM